jgi:single-strand DNA-binding protein
MYLNRLTLIGFIGGDAEAKTISNGSTFTAFAVATQRSWKSGEGAWESRTEWHRCVSFGKFGRFRGYLEERRPRTSRRRTSQPGVRKGWRET